MLCLCSVLGVFGVVVFFLFVVFLQVEWPAFSDLPPAQTSKVWAKFAKSGSGNLHPPYPFGWAVAELGSQPPSHLSAGSVSSMCYEESSCLYMDFWARWSCIPVLPAPVPHCQRAPGCCPGELELFSAGNHLLCKTTSTVSMKGHRVCLQAAKPGEICPDTNTGTC